MAYPDELLGSAISLVQVSPETQANLRRAVSTAYYALFHLLIGDACKNWSRPEQRARLARNFEHARMLSDLDIFLARSAFDGWKRIQIEQFAQDFLFSLLFKDKS
jgi:ABC-type sulfate transport system substrate-binding protein